MELLHRRCCANHREWSANNIAVLARPNIFPLIVGSAVRRFKKNKFV